MSDFRLTRRLEDRRRAGACQAWRCGPASFKIAPAGAAFRRRDNIFLMAMLVAGGRAVAFAKRRSRLIQRVTHSTSLDHILVA